MKLGRVSQLQRAICVLIFFALTIFTFAEKAEAACPAGTQPITNAAILVIAKMTNPAAVMGTCYNPSDPNVGAAAGDAKQWLQQHATTDANISCLSAPFAEKLKTFMEAVPGGIPVITSGYRGTAAQNAAIQSGASHVTNACQSYHPYGLAADFNNNRAAQTQWMRANAHAYGFNILGDWDANHFQDNGGLSGQCGACPTDTTGGDGVLQPSASSQSPSSGLANQVRQALGMQQQPPPPPPPAPPPPQTPTPLITPTPTTASGNPTACTPQYSCSNGSYIYQTSSCTTLTVQTCKYGCSSDGTTCALSPQSASSSSATGINIGSGTGTGTSADNGSSSSTFALIDQYANPVSDSIDIGTGTPIALNQDLQNIGGDTGALSATSSDYIDASGNVVALQPQAQQTFTSGDLANSPGPTPMTTSNSFVGNLIAALQSALAFLGNYLKPFGGQIPSQNASTVYLE
jgi:hypothetical protein